MKNQTTEIAHEELCVDAFREVLDGPPVLEPVERQWYARMDAGCLNDIAKESGIEVVPYDDIHEDGANAVVLETQVTTELLTGGDRAAKAVIGMIFSHAKLEEAKKITSKVMLKIYTRSLNETCMVFIRVQVVE